MIINKKYEVNYADMDSVITTMAKDIEEGYTVDRIERPPLACCTDTCDLRPSVIIILHNKKADDYVQGYRLK
jgi:hypothetical protein